MTNEIGLPRIKPDELRVRAMAAYQEHVKAEAERGRRYAAEQFNDQAIRAAKALRHTLHVHYLVDPVAWDSVIPEAAPGTAAQTRRFAVTLDDVRFEVIVDDEGTADWGATVYVILPCSDDESHTHGWRVTGPVGLGAYLTDPPGHVEWEVMSESKPKAIPFRDPPTPEQNLVDAIRLFVRNEIDGE